MDSRVRVFSAIGSVDEPSEYIWTCPNCERESPQEFGSAVICPWCGDGWCEICSGFSPRVEIDEETLEHLCERHRNQNE